MKKTLPLKQWKLAFVRGGVFTGAQLTFSLVIGFVELAKITALGHTSGLFLTLLSIFFRERVGRWRWGALLVGFISVV